MNIINLIRKDIIQLSKSPSAVLLTFVVPMIITLIFGAIFGGFGGEDEGISDIRVLWTDLDNSDFSAKVKTALDTLDELTIYGSYKDGDTYQLFDMETMDQLIKKGRYKVGIVVPDSFGVKIESGKDAKLIIHYDPKYSIEYNIVSGLMQKTLMMEFPQIIFNKLVGSTEDFLGIEESDKFYESINNVVAQHFPEAEPVNKGSIMNFEMPDSMNFMENPIDIESVELLGKEEKNTMFVQYVAGMAVMFLLFSVTYGGSSLLEEKHAGTIKRLLIAPVSRGEILTAKMLYISLLGLLQLIVLFIFGWIVFGLDIFKDLPALIIMIVFTAVAASSLGIFLASICKNERQVNSLATLVILGMSALGGSMVPTFVMPSYIRTIGKFTLNHWAMQGFTGIFWRNMHLDELWPNIAVLAVIAIVFSSIAIIIFNKRLID